MSFIFKPDSVYTANTQPVWSSFVMRKNMDLEQGPRFSASVLLLDSNWISNMLNMQSGQEDGKKKSYSRLHPTDLKSPDRRTEGHVVWTKWWPDDSESAAWTGAKWPYDLAAVDSQTASMPLCSVHSRWLEPSRLFANWFLFSSPRLGELGLLLMNTARRQSGEVVSDSRYDAAMPPSPKL